MELDARGDGAGRPEEGVRHGSRVRDDEVSGGRPIRVTTSFWKSKIEFLSADDDVLFRYLTEGFLRQEAQLEVMPALERLPELPWLLLFGWYLVVMMHEDSAATAVIIG